MIDGRPLAGNTFSRGVPVRIEPSRTDRYAGRGSGSVCKGYGVPEERMFSYRSTRNGVGLAGLLQPGDHACYFFRAGDEIGEVLVPYFKAGLERNEQCVWLTGHLYGRDRAVSEMRAAVADFDRRVSAGQISILDHAEWYATLDGMSVAEKVRGWAQQRDGAVAAGYAGLRASGNASFVDARIWDEFLACERASNAIFPGQPVAVLCGYGFDRCSAKGVVDVLHCHGLGLARRHGRWDLLEVRSHDSVEVVGHAHHAPSAGRREELRGILEDQLAMFIGACPERIALAGTRVDLSEPQATKLAILLSELATNAAKYGALASQQGRLAVQWHVVANGSRKLHIAWTESGAVNLAVPETVGSGTQLMAGLVESCTRFFSPTGMACELELRLDD